MQYDAQRPLFFFQNVNTSLLQVAMLGKNLSHLTSGGGEDGESGRFSTFSSVLSQSQTFFFVIILDIFSFLSRCLRLVSRRGPLCLWQYREEAACRGGGQAGELRLQFDVDLYRVVYKFISTSVASAIIAQKP